MLSAFIKNPQSFRYLGQDEDEDILLVLRAHVITNLSWISPAVLLFAFPFILPKILAFYKLDFSFVPSSFVLVFLMINYLLVLVMVFEGFLGWYFNVNILTNKKIVDVDFGSVMTKTIDLALLRDVQESNAHLKGIIGMIFNYGDVFVQTAASNETIDFKNVPHPDLASDIVMDAALKVRHP